MSFMNDFKHNEIQLECVKLATNNFQDNPIGGGGFGQVYKGELSWPDGHTMTVAFKRLDKSNKSGQGNKQFWNEIMMLYDQLKHENLVSLLYHCVEGGEQILLYEYAYYGSLDKYLGDTNLTWSQRLNICLGAAHGLNYLHDSSVIHRDVKSANILLFENGTAKISDFGLSKLVPRNQKRTYLVSNAVGTHGYVDPLYNDSGLLSKESDVYSFGVVLLEVMFGRLCNRRGGGILVHTWKERLAMKRLDDIICIDKIDRDSLETYINIANMCLNPDHRKQRPKMDRIIKELEVALNQQEKSQDVEEMQRFTERVAIVNRAATPDLGHCRSRKELGQLLSQGIILKENKKISLNKNGHYCEMIPPKYSILKSRNEKSSLQRYDNSKAFLIDSNHQIKARTEFLSTDHISYTVNLVYKYGNMNDSKSLRVPLRYQVDEEANYWTSCVAERKDGLLRTELFQFTSNKKDHRFNINLLSETRYDYHTDRYDHEFVIEGIEFLPAVKHVRKPITDVDPDEKQKLLSDYANLIKWSGYEYQFESNAELFNTLRKGILINKNGKKWISTKKNFKKICMLPAREVLDRDSLWKALEGTKSYKWKTISESRSRFEEVAELLEIKRFDIKFKFHNKLLSHGTNYACYLVYKIPKQHSDLDGMVHLQRHVSSENTKQFFYLTSPSRTPVIGRSIKDKKTRRKIKGHPKLRNDGWMEIQMMDFFNDATGEDYVKDHYCLNSYNKWYFTGLVIQGIEFRPAKVCFSPLC